MIPRDKLPSKDFSKVSLNQPNLLPQLNGKRIQGRALDAVKQGLANWRLQAKFSNVKVMAVTAIAGPGCLKGPALDSMASSFLSGLDGDEQKIARAAVKGAAKCFKQWQDQVTIPGLPWYPAFAAFPGPQAPPMPNIPTPVIALKSSNVGNLMNPSKLKDAMLESLESAVKTKYPNKEPELLLLGIASALAQSFASWLASQQVQLVLGKGPVPTFAPPYVPVGPVVGGNVISGGGHFG